MIKRSRATDDGDADAANTAVGLVDPAHRCHPCTRGFGYHTRTMAGMAGRPRLRSRMGGPARALLAHARATSRDPIPMAKRATLGARAHRHPLLGDPRAFAARVLGTLARRGLGEGR